MAKSDGQIELSLNIKATYEKISAQLKQLAERLSVKVTGKLDVPKTKKQINADLSTIKPTNVIVGTKINKTEVKKQLKADLKSLDGTSKIKINADVDVNKLKKQLKNITPVSMKSNIDIDGAENLEKVSDGMDSINKKSATTVASITLMHRALNGLEQAARKIIDTSSEMDEKLTDLRMVTGDSYETAAALTREYNLLAQELGATTGEVMDASSEWLRQGKSIEETTELIGQSMILSKVGAMDSATATERLTSALNGYKLEASDAASLVDKFTSVDMAAAVSADELAEALSHTASSAHLAGLNIDQIISYITVVAETSRKSASVVGESFKSVLARLQKVTNGDAVDDFGDDISKVETTLRSLGIELRSSETEFRNIFDVIDEVGRKFNGLDSVVQRQIVTAMGGVYQSENLLALLTNYDKVAKYIDISANSAGTAEKKFNAYQDSIKAHYNAMVAAAESLAMNTATADFMKTVLDATAALLEFIDNTHLLQISLSTLAAAGAVKLFTTIGDKLKDTYKTVSQLSTAFNILGQTSKSNLSAAQFEKLLDATKGLNASQLRLIITQKNLTNEQRMQLLMASGLTQQEAQQTLATLGLATAEGTATAATFSLSGAFKALGAAIAANPIGFIITALTATISIFSSIISELEQAEKDARREIIETGDAIYETADEIENAYIKFKKYSQLTDKTAEDENTLTDAVNSLNKILGDNAVSFDTAAESADNYADSIRNSVTAALKEAWIDAKKVSDAAMKDLKADTYNWKGSQITITMSPYIKDNSYAEARKIVEDSFEYGLPQKWYSSGHGNSSYELEVQPENWNKNRDDMDAVVEYYNKLLDIQDKLAEKDLMQTDIYDKITTKINDLKDGVSTYVEAKYNELKLNYEWQNGVPTTIDDYNKMVDAITKASGANELYQEQLKSLAYDDFYDDIITKSEDANNSTNATIDKLSSQINSYRETFRLLKEVSDEYNSTGAVTAETYKKVIDANKDFAGIFDFSSGAIELESDKMNDLADSLMNEYGATLAASGASSDQIKVLYNLASALRTVTPATEDTVKTLNSLVSILSDVKDGTEYSTLAILELIEQYPELTNGIIETESGYRIEEAAIIDVISQKANELKINESLIKSQARLNLIKGAGGNEKTADNVDKIMSKYAENHGANISSFNDYETAWEEYYGKNASGNWVDGLEEYVEASINEAQRLEQIQKILDDLSNPQNYKWGSKPNSSTSKKTETEFEKAYKYHQHMLNMDRESVAEYIKWLNFAYKDAYTTGQIELNDYYKYMEEVYEKSQVLFKDSISDMEHQISMLSHHDGNTDEIVTLYKAMQKSLHNEAEKYRAMGLSENADEIQELQKQWWDYYDAIKKKTIESYDNIINNSQNAITSIQNLMDNAIGANDYEKVKQYSSDIVAEYKKMQQVIHDEADYYRSRGYSETSDEVSKLSDLWYEYRDKIIEATSSGFKTMVENTNSALDEIQGVYSTLTDAAQEYAESGFITEDTYQSILALGTKYLAMLQDENGQLIINEENIKKVIAARTNQLAIEQSLQYIEALRSAITDENTVALNNLLFATDAATDSTWGLVYAQLASLDLTEDQYSAALQRINTLRSLADTAVTSIGQKTGQIAEQTQKALEDQKKLLEEQKQALDDILGYVEDMIKQEVENHIDALEDEIDKYKQMIDLKKEDLKLAKEKDEYEKDVKDKVSDIAKLEARIQQLSLDDSREAQAEKIGLEEELAELQQGLADKQSDHAYDTTNDMLDNMADAYEQEKNEEIEILKDSISSQEKIYQLAIARINNNWDSLYQDLINWNTQYGSNTNNTISSAWQSASQAVQQYGSYLNAVASTQAALNAMTDATSSSYSGSGSLGNTGNYSSDVAKGEQIGKIVKQMKANSASWNSSDDATKQALSDENVRLAAELQTLIGKKLVRGQDGVWYIGSVGGTHLYDVYHKGGIVGGKSSLKDNETMAVLENGEMVLDSGQKKSVFTIVKNTKEYLNTLKDITSAIFGNGTLNNANAKLNNLVKDSAVQASNQISTEGNRSIAIDASIAIHGDVDKNMWDKVYPVLKDHPKQVAEVVNRETLNVYHKSGIFKKR